MYICIYWQLGKEWKHGHNSDSNGEQGTLKVLYVSESTFGCCFICLKIDILVLHLSRHCIQTRNELQWSYHSFFHLWCLFWEPEWEILVVGVTSVWNFSQLSRARGRINVWKLPEWAEQGCALSFQIQPSSAQKLSSKLRRGCLKRLLMLFLCSSLLPTCQHDKSHYRNVRSLWSFLFSSAWSEKEVMENDANKNDWRKANEMQFFDF